MKQSLIIVLTLICSAAFGQNLVPNGTFNYSDTCSYQSLSSPQELEPWTQLFSSPDYYHPCFPSSWSVPMNFGGGGQSLDGEGYIGVYTYAPSFLLREFMTVELIEPLGSNVEYHFTFHVSRMDSCWYATKNIGAYFSPNVPNATLPDLLNVAPQVEYGGTSFLIDNNGWTRIDGIFTANGGEKYLTIGNFDNDENTDSLFVSGGGVFRPNQPDFYKTAYYYIDEVSLIPDSVYLDVGEIDERETPMNIYPNPASKLLAIEYANFIQSISVFDMFGRLVMQTDGSKQKQIEISVEALTHGIYNVVVVDDKGQRQTRRILKK